MLCPRNVHRIYLASVLLAAKLMDDNVFNNPYWAKVILSGIQAALGSLQIELNALPPTPVHLLSITMCAGVRCGVLVVCDWSWYAGAAASLSRDDTRLWRRSGESPRESCTGWSCLRCSSWSTGCTSRRTRLPRASESSRCWRTAGLRCLLRRTAPSRGPPRSHAWQLATAPATSAPNEDTSSTSTDSRILPSQPGEIGHACGSLATLVYGGDQISIRHNGAGRGRLPHTQTPSLLKFCQ